MRAQAISPIPLWGHSFSIRRNGPMHVVPWHCLIFLTRSEAICLILVRINRHSPWAFYRRRSIADLVCRLATAAEFVVDRRIQTDRSKVPGRFARYSEMERAIRVRKNYSRGDQGAE